MNKKPKIARNEDNYFVSIRSPLEARRHILESCKRAIMSMQCYERIMVIRSEKQRVLEYLKQSIKELTFLNNKLSQMLPEYNADVMGEFKIPVKKEASKEQKDQKKGEKLPPAPKKVYEKSEMEKLEDSLKSIEGKLNSLE